MKTNLKKLYGTNQQLQEDGVWKDFGDGISVKIRRANSTASMEARREAEKPYLSLLRRNTVPDDVANEIALKHLALGMVVDWKGITQDETDGEGNPVLDEDGKPKQIEIPATDENKLAILGDDELGDFRDMILATAMDAAEFALADEADAAKN